MEGSGLAAGDPVSPPKVLTIAGSDSGGAAGLQADLKTLTAIGVYGMSVVTAVTAQNSLAVVGVKWQTPEFVAAQLDAVLSDYGADAVKTGFLGRPSLIAIIKSKLQQYGPRHIVIDPVLVNHRRQPMFPKTVPQGYRTHLLPIADLITPNRVEAALLLKSPIKAATALPDLEAMTRRLHEMGPKNVLLKGGQDGDEVVDIFYDGQTAHHLRAPYLDTDHTHGAGDTLSAAVCAYLSQGMGMKAAVIQAKAFTYERIRRAAGWQLGAGHGPLAHFL